MGDCGCHGCCACCGQASRLPAELSEEQAACGRTLYFKEGADRYRGRIEEAFLRLEPAAELSWKGDALNVEVPEERRDRLPVILRGFSLWQKENLPGLEKSYTPFVQPGGDDDDGGEGGSFFSRYRSPMLFGALFLFFASLAVSHWLSRPVFLSLLTAAYLLAGAEVILNAVKHLFRGAFLDEQFLMTAASLGAFAIGEAPEAAAVMLFYQVGEAFQRRAVGKSRNAIAAMMNLRPDAANLRTGDGFLSVAPEEVAVGEVIAVNPGERVPLDGVVVSGSSLLDTSALTGEPLPREAAPGDEVLSGSICQTGQILLQVTHLSGESAISRILRLVQYASGRKTRTERFITSFARYYTPLVVAGALMIGLLPLLFGFGEWPDWIHRALVFLVVSCPCALVISVPLSYFGGIGAASRQKILMKGSTCIDALAKVSTVVFDKTGTLTRGAFQVTGVFPEPGVPGDHLLDCGAHAEHASGHPIALALRSASPRPLDPLRVTEIEEVPGHGVSVRVDGKRVLAGNARFLRDRKIAFPAMEVQGTAVYVAEEGEYLGAVTIADELKPECGRAIEEIRRAGVRRIVMLTGDRRSAAEEISRELRLDDFRAELLPAQKAEFFEELERTIPPGTKAAFVGDGINDAPVLARADIGIAMGGIGADAAVAAADVVLMTDQPQKVAAAIRIARKTISIARENILFALGVKAVILILGVLGLASLWLAVFGDVGVAALATLNAARALRAGGEKERRS